MARKALHRDTDAAKNASDQIAASQKRQAEIVAEMEERTSGHNVRPTPTQEENDLAKVGALDIDAKEPDGSPPEGSGLVPRNPGEPYSTRDMRGAATPDQRRAEAEAANKGKASGNK